MAKRIVAAWIEQIIEFDSLEERAKYAQEMPEKITEGVETPNWDVDDDFKFPGITLRIRKRYNKNNLWKFEDEKE